MARGPVLASTEAREEGGGKAMNAKQETQKKDRYSASECGAEHGDCPNAWKGSCDREAGHDGSHHCDRCNGAF
jgi:hypothetical protein